ncbi:MAG: GC-type dockerin domain-anchored protein [Planctomycetota bacterium]
MILSLARPFAAGAAVLLSTSQSLHAQQTVSRAVYRNVATSGEPVPGGLPGETYFNLEPYPVLSADGDALFVADTTADREVLVIDDGSPRILLATSETQPAEGLWLYQIPRGEGVIADDGSVTQPVVLRDGSALISALVRIDSAGGAAVLLREGDQVPGRPMGDVLAGGFADFAVSATGDVVTAASIVDANGEFVSQGVFVLRDGILTAPRLRGDPAPDGTPGHEVYDVSGCSMSPAGTARWLTQSRVPDIFDYITFVESIAPGDAHPTIELATNVPVPGLGPAAAFTGSDSPPVASETSAAVSVGIVDPDIGPGVLYGAVRQTAQALSLVAGPWRGAPDEVGGGELYRTDAVSMGTDGTIALAGDFEHPIYGREPLLMSASSTNELSVIAAAWQTAPTLVPGQIFESFQPVSRRSPPVFINSQGQSMFYAFLNPSRAEGLWLHDPSAPGRTLFPLVLEDSVVDVQTSAGIEQRSIDFLFDVFVSIREARACADNGRPSPFANEGTAIFLAFGDIDGVQHEFIMTSRIENVTCPADTNGDGLLNPADFSAWAIAFNNRTPACDQNNDGLCNPADFSAWVINFNDGCD